jgi:hypothetical protein
MKGWSLITLFVIVVGFIGGMRGSVIESMLLVIVLLLARIEQRIVDAIKKQENNDDR